MPETESQALSGVAETMLVTLYLRAMETQRPDGLIKDEKAVALVTQLSYDFERARQVPMSELNKVTIILRNLKFDSYGRDFISRCPDAVVVHIACGLDARFERVDNGRVEWFDLDLPEVIELRRKYIGDERKRYHFLGCSVFEKTWLDTVRGYQPRPFLFLAEGFTMYFEKPQIKTLVLTLRDNFPGAELAFDAFSPLHIWRSNLKISIARISDRFPRMHWGLWGGHEVERWGAGIHLLDDWGFLDSPEPRMSFYRWGRFIPLVARAARIYHYRLGNT